MAGTEGGDTSQLAAYRKRSRRAQHLPAQWQLAERLVGIAVENCLVGCHLK